MKLVVTGIIAALAALWGIPTAFVGATLPTAYGWLIALLFVAIELSYVSVRLVRVEARQKTVR